MFGKDYKGVKFIHLQTKIYAIIYIEREEKKMELNKRERKILEQHFGIYETESNYKLEGFTSEGVNMFIYIDKNTDTELVEQLNDYVNNFNVDEEIDIHRENEEYRNHFTIQDSLDDFHSWLDIVQEVIVELEEPITPLKCVGVNDTERGLNIVLIDNNDEIIENYDIEINIKGLEYKELYNLCYSISNKINSLYIEKYGELEKEDIVKIVREVAIK